MNYLQQQLLGEGQSPSADPRIGHAVNTVARRDRLLTDDEISEAATAMSDSLFEKQAQEIIAAPGEDSVDRLNEIARVYGQKPDAKQAAAAAAAALGVSEEPERRSFLAERANRVRTGLDNVQSAITAFQERIDALREQRVAQSTVVEHDSPAAGIANAAVYTANTVLEFLDAHVVPGFYAEVINIVKDVAPEVAGVVDFAQPEKAQEELGKLIRKLPSDKSKDLVKRIIQSASGRQASFLSDNFMGEADLLQQFLDVLETGEASGDFLAPLDYILGATMVKPVVTGTKALVKSAASLRHAPEAIKTLTRFPKGSIPWLLSDYKQGADNLLTAATSANASAATAAMGTNPAAVVGALVVPKPKLRIRIVGEEVHGFSGGKPITTPRIRVMGEAPPPEKLLLPLPEGKPFLNEHWLGQEEKLLKEAYAERNIREHFQLRLNDSVIESGKDGVTAYLRLGDGNGLGWAKASDAELWASRNLNIPYTVERDLAGGFQVQAQHFMEYGLDDVGTFLKPLARKYAVGKNTFIDLIARGSTQAELISSKALSVNRKIAKAFTGLSKMGSLKVQETLLKGEREGAEYSVQQLLDMGLTDKEVAGYNSVRFISRKALALKDLMARQVLKSSGYNQVVSVDNGQAFVKLIEPASIKPNELITGSARAVDLTTGQKVSLSNLDLSKHKLYRFFEETKSGYSYGVVPEKATVAMSDLPINVIKPRSGWMPRYYNAPYFIREVFEDGHTSAMYTARSPKAAQEMVDQLTRENPGRQFKTFEADAIAAETNTIADLTMLREQGLLVTSHRKPLALTDAEGGEQMLSVSDSIERLVASTSMSEGLSRWTLAMKKMFDDTYGKSLGFTMDLARTPAAPRDVGKRELYDEAMKIYNYVRLVNGLDAAGPLGQFTRAWRNRTADLFYNFGHKKKGVVGEVSQWFGDNASGLNPSIFRSLKSAAFQAYIGLNPLVQGPLQMMMIPTYVGVKHGLSYLNSGKLFTDSLILMFAKDSEKLDRLRRVMKLDSKYVESLISDYKNSGLKQMVDNHIMLAGTLGDARVATAGRVRKGMAAGFNAVKWFGFDLGVGADKKVAWLVMRNRAIKDGLPINESTLQKIAQDAEHLTGSLNRSDPLYSSDGIASLWLQFMSHPIKMAGRVLGAATGGRVGGETVLSAREQAQVVMAGLLSFGTAGYGVTELVERVKNKNQWDITPEQQLVIEQGLMGYAVNSLFRLADEGGDPTKLMFSNRYSPFATSGTLLTNAKEIGILMLSMDWDQLQDFIPNPASLKLGADMAGFLNFYYHLAGGTPADMKDEGKLAVMADFIKKFPITNNWLKYHMATNLGYKFDSRGKPAVEATKGEALAALFGLKSAKEYTLQHGNLALYGDYEAPDADGLTKHIKAAAADTASWLIPTLVAMGDGTINDQDAAKLIENHNITFSTGLEPVEYAAYRNELVRLVLQSKEVKMDRLVEQIAKKLMTGEVNPTASFRDKMYGIGLPKDIVDAVERMFQEVKVEDAE